MSGTWEAIVKGLLSRALNVITQETEVFQLPLNGSTSETLELEGGNLRDRD